MRNGVQVVEDIFAFGEHRVFGATALMLRNFLDIVTEGTAPTTARVLPGTGIS
jgi:hypothetical protein